jgi:hypothetical protein
MPAPVRATALSVLARISAAAAMVSDMMVNSGIKPPLLVVDAKRFYRSCEK